MKINVVAVNSGWILTKIAERIVVNAPEGVSMAISPAVPGGNNFYVDITNCYRGHLGGKEVGLFTHIHANDPDEIKPHWWTLDHIIHMSRASKTMFESSAIVNELEGHKPFKATHSSKMPGEVPEGFEYKKPTIGIFQRGKYEGKGFNVMMRLADNPVAAEFNWIFAGNDWSTVTEKLRGITDVVDHGDSNLVWPGEYKQLYDLVDYVLIPSKWEGGPMGLLEAAALGKQVIASRVGWAGRELPVDYSFKPGNDQELGSVLNKLIKTRKTARKVVENLSYENYAKHVVRCFKELV